MGANNKNQGYGPNPGQSGGDPRGRIQNQGQYQQQRYESQQGPMINSFAQNYGRGSEADWGNYMDIMNRYRDVAGGGGAIGQFAKTGGYTPQDLANIRARGVAPVRAAYGNAEREVNRQRALQGGYSPNAIATQAKMAREQGQSMSDASTNVEAMIAQLRNQGQQFGLGQQMNALQGMGNLYGTTPGMASTFGNQLLSGVGQGGQFGINLMGQDIAGQQLPGRYEQTTGRIGDIANMAYPWLDYFDRRNQPQQQQQWGGNMQMPMPAPRPRPSMPSGMHSGRYGD